MATSRSLHDKMAIDWVSAAWNSIKSETIVESFKCCGITASVDGSDDTKMFCCVPRVIIESDDESEVGDDDSDGMVTGDDFEGFDADDDLFEITVITLFILDTSKQTSSIMANTAQMSKLK